MVPFRTDVPIPDASNRSQLCPGARPGAGPIPQLGRGRCARSGPCEGRLGPGAAALPSSAALLGLAGHPSAGKSTCLSGCWWYFSLRGCVLIVTRGLGADGWCGSGMEVCGGAALGWTRSPEEALRSGRLGGDGRAARAALPGPEWSCRRCPLRGGLGAPWCRAGRAGSSRENGEPWVRLCGVNSPGFCLWDLWISNGLKRQFHLCAVVFVTSDNRSALVYKQPAHVYPARFCVLNELEQRE